jgi:hypothetical protein
MLNLACDYVRDELSAFHDEELPVTLRIAIADHLENCPACAVEASDLRAIGEALQASGRSAEIAWMPGLGRIQADTVERINAENKAALGRRFRDFFDDRRRASASLGISLVGSVCLVIGAFVLAHGQENHPNSLKAVMTVAVGRGNIDLPSLGPVEWPRANAEAVMPVVTQDVGAGDECDMAFAVLVKSDGNLAELEFLGEESHGRKFAPGSHQVAALLSAAATARFEPARVGGAPVPANVVWLVTHRTVRARADAPVGARLDGSRL